MGESWIVWSEFGAAEEWLVGSVSAATQTEVKGIEGRKGRVLNQGRRNGGEGVSADSLWDCYWVLEQLVDRRGLLWQHVELLWDLTGGLTAVKGQWRGLTGSAHPDNV